MVAGTAVEVVVDTVVGGVVGAVVVAVVDTELVMVVGTAVQATVDDVRKSRSFDVQQGQGHSATAGMVFGIDLEVELMSGALRR